jgi:hypothetical protein
VRYRRSEIAVSPLIMALRDHPVPLHEATEIEDRGIKGLKECTIKIDSDIIWTNLRGRAHAILWMQRQRNNA